ncbi:MAG TPA: UDP-N-acetylmuramate--L-alanine ligase [Flavisolibacter sp.]|nr:UDP-N-acetylmuramate--L-alanine ligase [Flavisolibacter sp.]
MSKETNIGNTQISSLNGIKKVYFIGIGGIGMSAIARYFHSKGIEVSGYDRTQTELTKELDQEGISIHYNEDVAAIPKDVELVVYTPAVPKEHAELVYYQENGYKVVKRSDVLQAISADSFNICIAGTHGKTTITTMIAHILRHSGYGCNTFLGGISVNYGTNFWSSANNVCVIEADEYDRSFLKLSPNIAIITAMDADHLDIYGDEKTMQDAFVAFGNKIREDGLLVSKFGLKRIKEVKVKRKIEYSLQNDSADVFAQNIKIEEGGYVYDVNGKLALSNVELRIGGMHNVENSLVAMTVAIELGIDAEKIKAAVADFKGVKRRFEYIIPPEKKQEGGYVEPVLIDDYAHHPEELRALLTSVRSLFPQRIVTVIFQPHLFTRTRDLAEGFAEVLSIADRVILLPIYPARELPIEGVTSEMILKKVDSGDKVMLTKDELLNWMEGHELNKEFGEVIVMAGAGDIDALVQPVKNIIVNK